MREGLFFIKFLETGGCIKRYEHAVVHTLLLVGGLWKRLVEYAKENVMLTLLGNLQHLSCVCVYVYH